MVAPYEADAQMAYLAKQGIVDAIMTQDSDLLLYDGVKTVLFKFELETGMADVVNRSDLGNLEIPALHRLSFRQFRQMCILSGCDYLEGLRGLGLQTAYKYILEHRTPDRFLRAVRETLSKKSIPIPEDYEIAFYRAELTFEHQTVFCSRQQCLLPLSPIDEVKREVLGGDLGFLGRIYEAEKACGVARGALHPDTFEPFVVATVSQPVPPHLDQENLPPSQAVYSQPVSNSKLIVTRRITSKRTFDLKQTTLPYAQRIKASVHKRLRDDLSHIPSYLIDSITSSSQPSSLRSSESQAKNSEQ